MNDIQNSYNQQLPPPQPSIPEMIQPGHPPGQWQRRVKSILPKWFTQYSVVVYLLALAVVSFMYSAFSLPWYYMLSGVVAIVVFFFYGSHLIEQTNTLKIRREKNFEKRIFLIAFVLRAAWMFLIYNIFMQNYGDAFGFENADATYYHDVGQFVAGLIRKGNFHFYDEISYYSGHNDISDMGYAIYVGVIYWLTGANNQITSLGGTADVGSLSIITVRLLKCLWSAFTVLLIYRLAKRNFGEQTGRIAAIFCALWPNFWYYCGTHLKETEMVFLCVLFIEQADQMLRSRQFTAWKVIPVLAIGAAILGFRTPLALVAFLSLIFSVVMSSSRVVSWGKRVIVGGLAVILIGFTFGNSIMEQSRGLLEQTNQQHSNMEWRGTREHGNSFAKYAGKSVFAPLIFTIPFPSMVRPYDGQDVQQLLNGGNFVKNIISFFTIFAMVMLLISGEWREHLLPLSLMLGYLVVLTMSTFAQSERFHQPAMPFELMFAAYGLSIAITNRKYKRWFMYWCGVMFVACIAWNWFKIAGRGLD